MKILVNGESFEVEVLQQDRAEVRFLLEGREYHVSFAEAVPSAVEVKSSTQSSSAQKKSKAAPLDEDGCILVLAPMPGVVTELQINVGQRVEANQALLQIEAMKMQNAIFSPSSGEVSEIYIEVGAEVGDEQALVKIRSTEKA